MDDYKFGGCTLGVKLVLQEGTDCSLGMGVTKRQVLEMVWISRLFLILYFILSARTGFLGMKNFTYINGFQIHPKPKRDLVTIQTLIFGRSAVVP
jgi:hypothetical protein